MTRPVIDAAQGCRRRCLAKANRLRSAQSGEGRSCLNSGVFPSGRLRRVRRSTSSQAGRHFRVEHTCGQPLIQPQEDAPRSVAPRRHDRGNRVDACTGSEQPVGFHATIDQCLELPFATVVLGITVTVKRLDVTEAGDIVAICHRGRELQPIPALELPLPNPPPSGWERIEAYRRWARERW